MWHPDVVRFEELIKQKKLSGEVVSEKKSTDVRISGSSKEVLAVLKNEKGLFNYKNPGILRKVSK